MKTEQSLKNLRVADVELLITATHLKSMSKSAAFHHLSQSATSTAIRRVESAFGIPLCTHEKRQFRLTREGQVLLPRLELWTKQLKDLVLSKDQVPVRLAMTHALAQAAIPMLLSQKNIYFTQLRPDLAYAAVLQNEADLALVLDNAPWNGVLAAEVGKGHFQLYSKDPKASMKPVLLPEDQIEVLSLKQSWSHIYGTPIPVKACIPSWSLIATICRDSDEFGFLPDFLAKKYLLHPVLWQPETSDYRVLALYRNTGKSGYDRLQQILQELRIAFS